MDFRDFRPTPRHGATKSTLTFFNDQASFETAVPGLPFEDFSNSKAGPYAVIGCGPVIADGNDCFDPGGILDGLEISASNPGNQVVTIGINIFGNDTPFVGADIFADSTILTFTQGDAFNVGFNFYIAGGPENTGLEIFDTTGALLASTTAPSDTSGAFFGVRSATPIGSIVITSPVGAGELVKDVQFGPDPVAECDPIDGCCIDDFADGALDANWVLDDLGDSTGSFAEEAGGSLELTGIGSELYHGTDNGAFLHQDVSGDFRVELDITGVPVDADDDYRKGGLMVRESNDPTSPRVMVTYLPAFPDPTSPGPALQFDARLSPGGTAIELASTVTGISLPVRVAVQRRNDTVSVYFSTDAGTSWTQPLGGLGGEAVIPMAADVLAGPVVASYDSLMPMTMSFDDFAICSPDETAKEPTLIACDAEQALDWIYLLDLSGTMAETHGDPAAGEAKMDSIGAALAELNRILAAQEDGSRGALVTYTGTDVASANLAAGVQLVSGLTSNFDALATDIQAAVSSSIFPEDTTPAAIGLSEVLDLLLAERDPAHGAVVVWATDNLPNIDGEGRGPLAYTDAELESLVLTDTFGDFLPPGLVAWQGNYNPSLGTFDGEPVADAMQAIMDLRDNQGDARIYSLVPRGDGVNTPLLSEELLDFAAWYTQGSIFGGISTASLVAEVPALLTDVDCGQAGQAVISGTVWHDLNRNGIREAGEPGLVGINVTVDGNTVTTDADGHYSSSANAGSITVSIDSGDLPAGVNQPSADPDGTATVHTAVLGADAWQVVGDADFGYSSTSEGPLTGCEGDDFNDGSLDEAWSLAELGDADQAGVFESGGALQLTGDGTTAYAGTDNGAFLYRGIHGDFRAEVDITGFPVDSGGAYRKAGLMVREGLGDLDARIMIQYVPSFAGNGPALQFRARTTTSGAGDIALGSNLFGISLPVRVAIERSGNTYHVQYSTDGGTTWTVPAGGTAGSITASLGTEPLVGMNVVSYSASTALTAEFDDFSVCAP